VEASELARLVNEQIRSLCDRLNGGDPARQTAFLCECGCLTTLVEPATVAMTVGEYDALSGCVLAPGHRRRATG
jgi:hypothetical protein